MTFERVSFLDRAANFSGSLALLSGLILGAALLVLQSL